MAQVAAGIEAIRNEVEIHVACSLGMLQLRAGRAARRDGRAPLQPQPGDRQVASSERGDHHTWDERWDTLQMVRDAGMEVCCGGILGMGET